MSTDMNPKAVLFVLSNQYFIFVDDIETSGVINYFIYVVMFLYYNLELLFAKVLFPLARITISASWSDSFCARACPASAIIILLSVESPGCGK